MDENESDTNVEIIEEEPPSNRRKGIRNDATYKRNVVKKSRVKGLEHKNHKGVVVGSKSIGQPCRYVHKNLNLRALLLKLL